MNIEDLGTKTTGLYTIVFPYDDKNPEITVESEIFVNIEGKYEFKEDVISGESESRLLSTNFRINFKNFRKVF